MSRNDTVNPEMIVLARQSRGYTQAELAKRVPMTPGWLSMVESGIREIPYEKLAIVARELDYPVSFFYKSDRVLGAGVNEVFHRSRSKIPVKARDKDQAWCEITRQNLAALLKGVDLGDIQVPQYDLYEFDGNVGDIARAVRAKWQLPSGPVRNVVKVVEEAGAIVIPMDFESALVDATSRWPSGMPPLIYMGLGFPSDRVRFSVCHELGHLVMHQNGPNPYQEDQANKFAAEFLMPEREIKPMLMGLTIPKLLTLKSYWKTSMQALLMRAKDTGMISDRHYRALWTEMGRSGYRTREPAETDIPKEQPRLLQEIIGVYSGQMGYSVKDLAVLFDLHENEVCRLYFGANQSASEAEIKDAIAQAEQILREYRTH